MDLRDLIQWLRKTTDVSHFTVEIDLPKGGLSAKAKIAFPTTQRKFMEDWLKAFSIEGAEFEEYDFQIPSMTICRFPVDIPLT